MKLRPVDNYVVLLPDPEVEQSSGGIVIPDNAKIHRHALARTGTVVAVGPGKRNRDGVRMPIEIEVGTRVLYQNYDGYDHVMDWDDGERKLRYIRETDLLGILYDKPERTWQDERAEMRKEGWAQ